MQKSLRKVKSYLRNKSLKFLAVASNKQKTGTNIKEALEAEDFKGKISIFKKGY